ncbi:hypothetical protein [Mesorhizobium sp. SP-1A]|uniref:hypothetical protein n=1 Tax=Mesorhizobium sp. SP-1A TaxID=3077840 RepID=UPI0028F73B7F|nr:hypothetical protein [Mesorhizobium sp. SP-1A]
MRIFLCAGLMFCAAPAALAAGSNYDRALEKAAADIAAAKMGELRGSFSFAQELVLVSPFLPVPPAITSPQGAFSAEDAAIAGGGLAPAVERPPVRTMY